MVAGIEHSGIHFTLKKFAKLDKEKIKENLPSFGEALVEILNQETVRFCCLVLRKFTS
jgi:D-mannonate dehydratase